MSRSERSLVVGLTLNYRQPIHTLQCIESLLREGAEHVLVWDNSDDNGDSAAAVAGILRDQSKVSVHVSPSNIGFSRGVNRGIDWISAHFPGSWILVINNDARLAAGAIPLLCEALRGKHNATLAYGDIDQAGNIDSTVYYQRHSGLLTRIRLPGSFPHASGCCLLVATERLQGKLFDEDFFMYGEDVELGARLGAEAMAHVPQTLVFHEGTVSSGLGSAFYEARMVAAHWLLAHKLARGPVDRGVLITGRIISLSARGIIRALRYRSKVPLQALYHGWQLAHGADSQRKPSRPGSRTDT